MPERETPVSLSGIKGASVYKRIYVFLSILPPRNHLQITKQLI